MRFIVPAAAGGSADAQPRIVRRRLAERWGQTVVVENRLGANDVLAAQAFLQAPPDGHTVFASLISVIPLALVVHPSVPANTLPEFLALSRRLGDGLAHASAGIGTPSHLTTALTRAMGRGGNPTHVPFGSSAPR